MKRLIICGSTGTQGGAVLDAMKDRDNWELIGFSRDLEQPKIQELTSRGLKMLEGDLADLDSLVKAFEGADAVFGLTQPWNKGYTKVDTDLELKQGKNLVDACLKTGVKHLVFSSAAHGEEEKTGLPHVDVKIDIEEYTRNSGLGYT
ncbi:MAG: NmrA family NAD(P)-binding protein, partial [Proteobacteria bacterium]|nr:NmrA family NAD(P)-binding protein [Pseudomonadota bacterium]